MRCGSCESAKCKVYLPCASVFVRVSSCIVCFSSMRMTSSPAAGLLVVLLVMVPLMSAAKSGAASKKQQLRLISFFNRDDLIWRVLVYPSRREHAQLHLPARRG